MVPSMDEYMEARLKPRKPNEILFPIGARIVICEETMQCNSQIGDTAVILWNHPYDNRRGTHRTHHTYIIIWDDINHGLLTKGCNDKVRDDEFYYTEMLTREEITTHWSPLIRLLNKLTDDELKGWD